MLVETAIDAVPRSDDVDPRQRVHRMMTRSDDAVQPSGRSPYFEAPELLPEASAELVENHLALCPTCCAKWHHARATSDADVVAALQLASCSRHRGARRRIRDPFRADPS